MSQIMVACVRPTLYTIGILHFAMFYVPANDTLLSFIHLQITHAMFYIPTIYLYVPTKITLLPYILLDSYLAHGSVLGG